LRRLLGDFEWHPKHLSEHRTHWATLQH
jgi:hypothetical protein